MLGDGNCIIVQAHACTVRLDMVSYRLPLLHETNGSGSLKKRRCCHIARSLHSQFHSVQLSNLFIHSQHRHAVVQNSNSLKSGAHCSANCNPCMRSECLPSRSVTMPNQRNSLPSTVQSCLFRSAHSDQRVRLPVPFHARVRKARVARRVAFTSCRQRPVCRGLRCSGGISTVPNIEPPSLPSSMSRSIL